MGLVWSSYYGFARVSEQGPEVKNWVSTDGNWQLNSLLFKKFELHKHNASTPMRYPGYNILNPATPATPLLTLSTTGGFIAAGTNIGIRGSYVDQYGLETEAWPEISLLTPPVVARPNAPAASAPTSTPVPGALPGGTYIYAITKRMNTGESALSDVTVVDVPFDKTSTTSYTVPLAFDPIGSYSDGTDSILIYRTTGFDSNFVLLKAILATPGSGGALQNGVTTYTDGGVIQDLTHQPPQASEFGKQNKVNINWNNINFPSTAFRFRIYLTQQLGVWGNNHLLQDYLLVNPSTPVPNSLDYLGTENLTAGYPLDFTQIPYGAPLINLTSEAVGAPIYTQAADTKGWQTYNFVFPDQNHSTPLFGNAYVDSSVGQLKIALSTPGGVGVYTTLAGVGSGYAHPTVESGGHPASRIQFAPQVGGPTIDQIGSIIATPVAGGSGNYRIQATNLYKVTATPADLQNSTVGVWLNMPDMDTITQWPTGINPDFTGQWFEADFQSWMNIIPATTTGQIISTILLINGVQIFETMASLGQGTLTSSNTSFYGNNSFTYATPLTRSNNRFQVQWQLSQPGYALSYGGNVVGQAPRRYFLVKELF